MANKTLRISELFYSIQGESTFAGLPCVFIRLAGCNLRCTYCDAQYSYLEPAVEKSFDEILAFAEKYPYALIEFTGGEPLLQNAVCDLMQHFIELNRTVLLETNGSCSIHTVPDDVHVILDIKTPSSGYTDSFHQKNLAECLRRNEKFPGRVELKFVLTDAADYLWAKAFLTQRSLFTFSPILFSPVQPSFPLSQLAECILHDQLPVRLQAQLHKCIWPAISRGV